MPGTQYILSGTSIVKLFLAVILTCLYASSISAQTKESDLSIVKKQEIAMVEFLNLEPDLYSGMPEAMLESILSFHEEAAFDYDFPILESERYFHIDKSDDGKLKIYMRDCRCSGGFDTVVAAQYKDEKGNIRNMKLQDAEDMQGRLGGIIHLRDSVYVMGTMLKSGFDSRIVSFTPVVAHKYGIEFTDGGFSYGLTYYLTYGDHLEALEEVKIDTAKGEAVVPQMIDDIEYCWSGRYERHTWNGKEFVKQPGSFTKGIHKDISEFRNMMVHFETEGYTIWVDRMGDNSIRYSSWKRGASPDKKPDLILYGGQYDKEKGICTFTNNEYSYHVFFGKEDLGLEVRKNGKVLLRQMK